MKILQDRARVARCSTLGDRVPAVVSAALAVLLWAAQGALSQSAVASERLWLTGINFAGAEFASTRIPGKLDKDYVYPQEDDIDYFLSRGANTIRLPFRWERVQLNLGWELDQRQLALLHQTVSYITGQGGYVVLDPHNYARYFGKIIGSSEVPVSAFAVFWAALAENFKDNERVIFGLMNEPNRIHAEDWRKAAEAAIVAIRATGAKNLILVPGAYWSGAHSWTRMRNGSSNALAFRDLSDPADNMVFEVHQYFDSDSSGTSDQCVSETVGSDALEEFTQWLRDNGQRGFLGEFGAADNPVCLAALDQTLQYVSENSDVWIGWAYWAAGAWWGDYMFSVQPSSDGDKPQMKVLMEHFGGP